MNLTKVSKYTKIGVIAFAGIVAFYYVSVFVIIPIGSAVYKNIFPPKNQPTLAFGKLEPLKLESKQITNEAPKFTLNTKNGALPVFPDRMIVYKFNPVEYTYNAGRTASEHATRLFMTDANLSSDISGDTYRWLDPATGTSLSININKKDLVSKTPLNNAEISAIKLPINSIDQSRALGKFNTLLFNIERYNDDLYPQGTQYIAMGRYKNDQLVETTSTAEAQIVRVDLFRSINKYPIFGPTYRKGLLHGWIANPLPGEDNQAYNYPLLELYYHTINQDPSATYPVIPIATVWQEVIKNKGIISEVVPKGSSPFQSYTPVAIDRIFVNNIRLAYVESEEIQEYLQPIYVFEGNYTNVNGEGGNIYIYYPAIAGTYYKNNSSMVLGVSATKE